MKKYCGIQYEEKVDCFARTAHIKTEFLYGNLENIPNPLFTVVIPTYKRVNFLKEAIESVVNQWHAPFQWDILVIDNEPYDGKKNETEKLIRKIDNPRILYYRNHENMRPGDNFNRGIFLARGKWIMMLHDDDILIWNSLQNMGRIISFLEKTSRRQVGAVNAMYFQFTYDPEYPEKYKRVISEAQSYFTSLPTDYHVYHITHRNVLFTGHIGGDVPSNGATFNRAAMLDIGGFNEDFGISGDLILNYCMENKYDVYSTMVPYGLYRWGGNTMSRFESTFRTVKAGFDFREYVYSKNLFTRIWGRLFRASQHRGFTAFVIGQRKKSVDSKITISDFNSIYDKKPNMHWYSFYINVVGYLYGIHKKHEMNRLFDKAMKKPDLLE